MPVLSLFAQSLGAGPEPIGFIVAASTLTGVFLKWPAGALSDLYDRRWLLLVGLLAFALPPFCYLLITDISWLIALRFVHGMATAVFAPIALAVVADLHREARGAAYGAYTAATQAGAMLGPLLGGWLLWTRGFSTTFVTAGTLGVIAVLLFFLIRFPPLILLGLVVCAGSLAAIQFTTPFVGLMALSALFGFGEAIVNAAAAALVADLSELKTLGSAMGMQGTIMDIGHASGPILSGVLIGALGFQLAFPIIAGLVLVAAGVFRASVGAERPVELAS